MSSIQFRSRLISMSAATCLLLALPVHADTPPEAVSSECVELASNRIDQLFQSQFMDLQIRLQVHVFSKQAVDQFLSHPDWHEGNAQWEEAYALLNPLMHSQMKSTMARLADHMKSDLPTHMDPSYCNDYLAFLHTKHGAVAQKLRDLINSQQQVSLLEKTPGLGNRLKQLFNQTNKAIQQEKNRIYDEPDFVKNQPPYRAAYKQAAEYDAQFENYGRQGEPALAAFNAEERVRTQKFVAEALAPYRDRIQEILQRFNNKARQ